MDLGFVLDQVVSGFQESRNWFWLIGSKKLVLVIFVFKIMSIVLFFFDYYFQILAGLCLPIPLQDPPCRGSLFVSRVSVKETFGY